ncbi:MAG: biotin--[acetyl-CoA-carboxylase] ligase [Thermoleophilia bacterium]|nr:biotin--[acetyl-CoA-carboxylase] ligase [Thermoleophilia bacterium]
MCDFETKPKLCDLQTNRASLFSGCFYSSHSEGSQSAEAFPAKVDARLQIAVARGLLGSSLAKRVMLLARLAGADLGHSERQPAVGWVSGEELGKIAGLSRAAVHKHIEKLRATGFAIVPAAGAGYRLTQPFGDLLVPEAVVYHLLAEDLPPLGLPYRYMPECLSTNLALKDLAESAVSGTTIAADCQTAGKGRMGRTWVSQPFKDLAFSVLLRPQMAPSDAPLLSLAAALAVAETLESLPGLGGRVGIKWPNDVLIEGRKISGILLEAAVEMDRANWAIVGIGVNVNSEAGALRRILAEARPDEWRDRPEPVSLLALLGEPVPRAALLACLLRRLGECVALAEKTGGRELLLEQVRRRDVIRGKRIRVVLGRSPEDALEGEAAGLAPGGQLTLRSSIGDTFLVAAGDVVLLEEQRAS